MKKIVLAFMAIFILSVITACSSDTSTSKTSHSAKASQPPKILHGPNITLVAKKGTQQLANGVTVPVWTFNGTAPGPEIRVKKGEKVKITLKNELPSPVSIHWHGYPVPNSMDGIPGVTQDAVAPGKSFTYEFTANKPGTYWYHSHQDSVNQVDRGLYGAFIVEDPKEKYDDDYTLMLDEWDTNKADINAQLKTMTSKKRTDSSGMHGMNMSGMNMNGSNMMMKDNMSMYNLYTINGKSGDLVRPLKVKKGDKVRLRFINAGYLPHNIDIHGHAIKIIATDGQPVHDPQPVKNHVISIAPGERYDVVFTADNPGKWYIEDHGSAKGTKGMKAIIDYAGSGKMKDQSNAKASLPSINLANYGSKTKPEFTLNQKYDVTYTMNLNVGMDRNKMVYTINGKTYPNTKPIDVKKGDRVKIKLVNRDMMNDHPIHLHGHTFQVLSKNGKLLKGSPIYKDTLNLKPGEKYDIAFLADNPGIWMLHCHELHHASAGMVTEVRYTDYHPTYVPKNSSSNSPE